MKPGNPMPVELTKRHGQIVASESIRDVFDALRELVTNSDDSYHRMGQKGGRIVVEIERHRGGAPSIIRIRDRAQGMTLDEMKSKIRRVGDRTSSAGDRGFFARGARDCAALGDMTFESIKDGRYHKAQFTKNWDFIPWEADGRKGGSPLATEEDHVRLGIRGHGSVVTIETHTGVPLFRTFEENLPLFWPLRDILDENGPSEVFIADGAQQTLTPNRVCYRMPEAELVLDESYAVPGYEGASARLYIYRAPEPLVDEADRFRRSGIIVKATRAVHECSFLLARDLESDPLAKRYFGRLECDYIDTICEEWDETREAGQPHPVTNPEFLVDPQRQRGLSRTHPFTSALYEYPTSKIRELVAEDRRATTKDTGSIGGDELQRRLRDLAKLAERFLQDEAEAEDLITDDEEVQDDLFQSGVLLVPTYAKIREGRERNLTLYVSTKLPVSGETEFAVVADSPAVTVVDHLIHLRPHKKRQDVMLGTVVLRGESTEEGILVSVSSSGLPSAEALVSVVPDAVEDRDFVDKLEFEHKKYKVREGRKKILRVFAQYPDLVTGETALHVISSSPQDVVVRGNATLTPVDGTNFAAAEIVVEARRQLAAPVTITATANDASCVAQVRVVQDERQGVPLKIEIVDKQLWGFRAQWADSEGRPNVLQVSAQHPSVRRYLGAAPEYAGQDSPLCRLLLAEIVGEAICRRTLTYQARNRSWEFDWARMQDNEEIVDNVMVHFNRLTQSFLPVAHKAMLGDGEVRRFVQSNTSTEGAEHGQLF
ncbi:MAG: hypothetical protein JXA57_01460 [Armatimonadetes bacterium]|nr:hypothetical protein [Armatimonadota bacterium]